MKSEMPGDVPSETLTSLETEDYEFGAFGTSVVVRVVLRRRGTLAFLQTLLRRVSSTTGGLATGWCTVESGDKLTPTAKCFEKFV